ncbi:hypothetical protein NPIL_120291 [Nephila pilipes]|uniref:Uncharacterized protein n=1 Tax=Nephila pilipes TaxID=299642 RepID=A0A8X6TK19_NEPPI|nr:hypothetical protein NPIL_120291 [Nephila pilipes]
MFIFPAVPGSKKKEGISGKVDNLKKTNNTASTKFIFRIFCSVPLLSGFLVDVVFQSPILNCVVPTSHLEVGRDSVWLPANQKPYAAPITLPSLPFNANPWREQFTSKSRTK